MATAVGIQKDFSKAMCELIELEYDAIEAYEATLKRLDDESYKTQISSFKNDHERHVRQLTELMERHQEKAPTGPDNTKQWLAKGKVILANLISDEQILEAMKTNEDDTNMAYQRMTERDDMWEDAEEILRHAFEDEKKHRDWIEAELKLHA